MLCMPSDLTKTHVKAVINVCDHLEPPTSDILALLPPSLHGCVTPTLHLPAA
jgi:hypothetical protein